MISSDMWNVGVFFVSIPRNVHEWRVQDSPFVAGVRADPPMYGTYL